MLQWYVFLFSISVLIATPHVSYAIVPPDLLFSLGSQLTQFFSLFAIATASLFVSIALIFRQTIFVFRNHFWPIITAVLTIVLLLVIGYSVWFIQNLETRYHTRIATIVETSTTTNHRFYNDRITLWQTSTSDLPQAITLDLNRREVAAGTFEHYYYLTMLGNQNYNEYTYDLVATSSPIATDFLPHYLRTPASDLSVRDTIEGTVILDSDPLKFTITDPHADFLTRHTDLYTRFHSATTALVRYRGEEYTMRAFTGKAHSRDFRHYVYFPGLENLHATTYQFILWDEQGNFYLLDDTTVHTPNPAYPSHTWVLHKEAARGYTKKAFRASVTQPTKDTWTITLPDIASSTITLSTTNTYHNRHSDRTQLLLEGTVTDTAGDRRISGIGHILK